MPLPDSFSLLVLGQGGSGLEVVSWAVAHLGGRVTSVTMYGGAAAQPTERTLELERAGASFVYGTETIEGHYDVCVACPGISEFSEFFLNAREASDEIMGEPEFSYRLSPERWCAVTGTNGKTTVTGLVKELMCSGGVPCVAAGNIGNALISEVEHRSEETWFAAELSSYQIATTSELHPHVAILLNITPDHLAWHRTHENYARAKIRLFKNMNEGDVAIVNAEDEGIAAFAEHIYTPDRRVLKFGLADAGGLDAAFVRDGSLVVRLAGEEHVLARVDELKITGAHNVLNALAAASAALVCGASPEGVRAGLVAFAPLPHRLEPVGEIAGVRYINDSKATNIDAVEKALVACANDRVLLLLGGADKHTPLEDFMSVVAASVVGVVCFGAARERFRNALEEAPGASEIDIAEADDLRDAVDVARSLAQRGDVVLLSPACASFDEFNGFEERGDAFRACVAQLALADAE